MKRQYNKHQILEILRSANKDIDETITKYIKGCLNKDDKAIRESRGHGFNILTPLQQSISCVIDYIESIKEDCSTEEVIELPDGRRCKAVEDEDDKGCSGCIFDTMESRYCTTHPCSPDERADGKDVIFVEIKEN